MQQSRRWGSFSPLEESSNQRNEGHFNPWGIRQSKRWGSFSSLRNPAIREVRVYVKIYFVMSCYIRGARWIVKENESRMVQMVQMVQMVAIQWFWTTEQLLERQLCRTVYWNRGEGEQNMIRSVDTDQRLQASSGQDGKGQPSTARPQQSREDSVLVGGSKDWSLSVLDPGNVPKI